MTDALHLDNVSKRYAQHEAVRALSLAVPAGTIYGILGPNGAGKSTVLRMVMNIITHDSGSIAVLGRTPEHRGVLREVGYLPEERGLYRNMNVTDAIVFFGMLKGMRRHDARRETGDWLERLGLGAWRNARVNTLSKGMQQKAQFIATVVHRPRLVILDEPQSGLDPVNQEVLRTSILALRAAGCTVVLSTHSMDEAETLCDAVCIIARGEKVLDGGVHEIIHAHRGDRFRVQLDRSTSRAAVASLESLLERLHIDAARGADAVTWDLDLHGCPARELLGGIAELPLELERFERVEPTLHQVFLDRVGSAAQHAERRDTADA